MKNLALILTAAFGLSAITFAQTGPAPKLDKTPQTLKTEKGKEKKKVVPAKKATPVKKVN